MGEQEKRMASLVPDQPAVFSKGQTHHSFPEAIGLWHVTSGTGQLVVTQQPASQAQRTRWSLIKY